MSNVISQHSALKNFWELDVWKQGNILAKEIYTITKTFPDHEKFGIISQIRRASTSVTANIAEGFGRYHYKDKIRFYYNSRGSASEVQNFILLCTELNYINEQNAKVLVDRYSHINKLINGLIKSIITHSKK